MKIKLLKFISAIKRYIKAIKNSSDFDDREKLIMELFFKENSLQNSINLYKKTNKNFIGAIQNRKAETIKRIENAIKEQNNATLEKDYIDKFLKV